MWSSKGHVGMRSRHPEGRRHSFPTMTGLARKVGDLVHDRERKTGILFSLTPVRNLGVKRERGGGEILVEGFGERKVVKRSRVPVHRDRNDRCVGVSGMVGTKIDRLREQEKIIIKENHKVPSNQIESSSKKENIILFQSNQ